MNIFVGNLSFDSTGADVKKLFEGFGNVASAVIVMEKEKKAPKSRGFGFVQMSDEQQALAAIAALNGKEFMGRILNVNPARPKGQKTMVWPPISQRAMVCLPIGKATST
jgi:RNA recognition motif-containing protein